MKQKVSRDKENKTTEVTLIMNIQSRDRPQLQYAAVVDAILFLVLLLLRRIIVEK